jgi:hypothetical protein
MPKISSYAAHDTGAAHDAIEHDGGNGRAKEHGGGDERGHPQQFGPRVLAGRQMMHARADGGVDTFEEAEAHAAGRGDDEEIARGQRRDEVAPARRRRFVRIAVERLHSPRAAARGRPR